MSIREVKDFSRRQRYYKIKRKVEAGLGKAYVGTQSWLMGRADRFSRVDGRMDDWWFKIYSVELLSSESHKALVVSNRRLRFALRGKGIIYEDCFCASVNSEDGLYSLKGFIRLKRGMSFSDIESIMRELWCFGSHRHELVIMSFDKLSEMFMYMNEKMLRGALEGDYVGRHLVKSEGW